MVLFIPHVLLINRTLLARTWKEIQSIIGDSLKPGGEAVSVATHNQEGAAGVV